MVVTPPDQTESRLARRKRMVAEMSNANTLKWIGVAFVVHLILIGATSVSYMKTHWFGKHEVEAMDDSKSSPAAVAPAPTPEKPATPAPATVDKTAAAPAAPSAPGLSDDDKKMAELKNTPEMKKLTATAKPGELPKTPSLKGIDDNP